MMYLKNVGKRALALVLALMMCVGMLSTTVFAEDVPEVKETEESTQAEVKEAETPEVKEPETTEDEVTIEDVQAPLAAKTLANDKCDHDWVFDHCAYTVQPVCTVAHSDVFKCSKCPATKTVHGRLHDHTYEWTNALDVGDWDTFHGQKCTQCGLEINIGRHDWQDATCVAPATCPTCGATKGKNNPNNHSGGTEVRDAKEATCTEDGYTGDTYCKGCGEKIAVGEVIEANGHTWSTDYFQKETGTGGPGHAHKCTVCQAYDKAVPCTFGDWSVTKAATCEEEGVKTRTCAVCGREQTDSIPANGHKDGDNDDICDDCGEKICEHNYQQVRFEKATCEKGSITVETCSECGKTRTIVGKALGHDFSEHVATASKDATCTEKGVDVYKCSRCPEKQVTELPLKSHTREDVAEKPATCTETGTKAHWKCTVCEKLFVGPGTGASEVKAEDLVIPIDLNNHTGLTDVWTPVDDSTHGKFCEDCGNQYETGDHSFDAWVYNEAEQNWSRTCVDCGYTQTTTDASAIHDCAEYWSEDFLPSGNGHAHVCTFPGCGNVSAPEAHEFEEWEVITAARPGVAGERAHTCWICGLTETETIPALPDTGTGTGGGDVVIDDTDTPLGGGDEVELDDNAIPLAGPVTRAEFVDYLYRREGSPEAGLSTFEDVPADHEYAYAIGWGQANDIAYGVSATEFLPDELVTVEQAKLFLSRYAKLKGIEMPELAALVGLDDQDYAMNCDEILGEFFGADE